MFGAFGLLKLFILCVCVWGGGGGGGGGGGHYGLVKRIGNILVHLL